MHNDAPQSVIEDGTDATDARQAAGPDRRRVMMLGATTGLGVAGVTALAGCGSDPADGTGASAPASGAPASAPAAGSAIAKLGDVPVGGSFAAAGANGQPIVVSQPEAGKVVAFSASCTHAGCKVSPEGKTLTCPCHNSTFDAFTGARLGGPATAPLPAVAVKLSGSEIILG